MKQKEKAKEILIKMQFQSNPLMFEQAKQCALIAIDEILDALNSDLIDYSGLYRYEANEYWQEVKHEIEKL